MALAATALSTLLILSGAFAVAAAADWNNKGGNAQRNGLTSETGPTSATVAWSGARTSLIAWLPVIEGDDVFTVRQANWPGQVHDAYVVCMDLISGGERWAVELPADEGDWTPWIAGVRDGKVYASRSGNGASVWAPMYCLDAQDGHTIWVSSIEQSGGPYDGCVFAPDGDLIVASFMDIWRFDAADGTVVWHASRVGSVSGSCGGALYGDALYVADAVPGGNAIVCFDIETGARRYQSETMSGFLIQNTPMCGADGTIYLARTQNNPAVDYYYAFTDTGTELVEKWHIPAGYSAFAEFAAGPDGSLYFIVPGPRLARIDRETGEIVDQTDVLSGLSAAHVAVDAGGKVFFSNGGFASGRLTSYEADLTERWSVPVPNINIGGPAIGRYGTLVVCGTGSDMRAYRTQDPADVGPSTDFAAGGIAMRAAPNPFAGATTIAYRLVRSSPVSLEVFAADGRRIAQLLSGEEQPAGDHALTWEGRDDAGRPVASGIYYLRLSGDGELGRTRVLLAR
ncbi:MAG: PQQ-binding-like beta-propeller repeat protein [Candidatus Eisenbacteria bacterium]|nr:PQQ-binding-like beta-propeller repeat protein [Candidatus Eisenbacteria bacterium]